MTPLLREVALLIAVAGGYLLLFPHRQVKVLMLRTIMQVPAFVALGLWFGFQLISGLAVLGDDSQAGGVAYAAHIGGFICGLILVKMFASAAPVVAPSTTRPYQRTR